MNTRDERILQRAREVWREPFTGFTIYDLLHAKGSPLDALLYAKLFWPAFRQIAGMTFLPFAIEDEADEKRIHAALDEYGDRTRVEEEFNRVEVASLFGRRRGETTASDDDLLAEYLVATWAAKLRLDYPAKQFRLQITTGIDGTDVEVTMYEQRPTDSIGGENRDC